MAKYFKCTDPEYDESNPEKLTSCRGFEGMDNAVATGTVVGTVRNSTPLKLADELDEAAHTDLPQTDKRFYNAPTEDEGKYQLNAAGQAENEIRATARAAAQGGRKRRRRRRSSRRSSKKRGGRRSRRRRSSKRGGRRSRRRRGGKRSSSKRSKSRRGGKRRRSRRRRR